MLPQLCAVATTVGTALAVYVLNRQPNQRLLFISTLMEKIMAITKIIDLPSSRALDYKARLAISGAGAGDWVINAFPAWVAPAPMPGGVEVFNFNNYTYIGQLVNQTTNVAISNSGANSTNTAVLLTSLGNTGR